jgi:hypothetical protein
MFEGLKSPYQKLKKSFTSFSPVDELMFLTWTVLADMIAVVPLFCGGSDGFKVRNIVNDMKVGRGTWDCFVVCGMFVVTGL